MPEPRIQVQALEVWVDIGGLEPGKNWPAPIHRVGFFGQRVLPGSSRQDRSKSGKMLWDRPSSRGSLASHLRRLEANW
jgi:hypothetical protein